MEHSKRAPREVWLTMRDGNVYVSVASYVYGRRSGGTDMVIITRQEDDRQKDGQSGWLSLPKPEWVKQTAKRCGITLLDHDPPALGGIVIEAGSTRVQRDALLMAIAREMLEKAIARERLQEDAGI